MCRRGEGRSQSVIKIRELLWQQQALHAKRCVVHAAGEAGVGVPPVRGTPNALPGQRRGSRLPRRLPLLRLPCPPRPHPHTLALSPTLPASAWIEGRPCARHDAAAQQEPTRHRLPASRSRLITVRRGHTWAVHPDSVRPPRKRQVQGPAALQACTSCWPTPGASRRAAAPAWQRLRRAPKPVDQSRSSGNTSLAQRWVRWVYSSCMQHQSPVYRR